MIFLSNPVQPLVFILTLKLQIGLKIFLFCFFNKEELLVIMDFNKTTKKAILREDFGH